MKEQETLERIPNQRSHCTWLPALLAALALVVSAAPARAQYAYIIPSDQFLFQGWDGNLQFDPAGYYWTPNWGNTPSAIVIIPLRNGLPAGWNVYNIYEWVPTIHSETWNVVWIAADGNLNNLQLGMPWAGEFGSNVQYLQILQNDQGGWVELGPGPQSDPTLDGGYGVWINGSDNPYLEIKYPGFGNGPESFCDFMVVAVPEPSTLALGLLGGFALLARSSRRAKH